MCSSFQKIFCKLNVSALFDVIKVQMPRSLVTPRSGHCTSNRALSFKGLQVRFGPSLTSELASGLGKKTFLSCHKWHTYYWHWQPQIKLLSQTNLFFMHSGHGEDSNKADSSIKTKTECFCEILQTVYALNLKNNILSRIKTWIKIWKWV